jgi:ATP:cob(I)alamin adenosyltransferase
MDKYLAYCFLYEDAADLRCDFEISTDEIASMVGLLRSLVSDTALRDDLSRINELIYHLNPSLRTETLVTEAELAWLHDKTERLRAETRGAFAAFADSGKNVPKFVLPEGCAAACYSHVIRNRCKSLVRLLSRHKQQGNRVDDLVLDFANLYSGYFYFLALRLNQDAGVKETEFRSRAYT